MGMLLRRHRREDSVKEEVVEEVSGNTFPRPTGGGWYELSNGEKVQGKGDAELREDELLTEYAGEEEDSKEGD